MSKVLITEADGRNTVCIVRSLAKRGIETVCAEQSYFALSFFSKYCRKRLVYPSPEEYPEKWVAWLIEELSHNTYEMVMPIGHNCFKLISENRDLISRYVRVPVADFQTWSIANNKAETLKLAMKLHIPCPKTCFIKNLSEVEKATSQLQFPLVIKPRQSCGSRGVSYVSKKDQMVENYNRIHHDYPFPMIQEFIPPGGNAYGVFLLFNRSCQPRALFAHKRLREFPVKGGPSTLRESVHVPELVDASIKLLKALNWYGVAMVEFKEDPRDGICKIMEINPRFWGSLPLAILSGVDFPWLLYKTVVDGDVEPVLNYPDGVRCRWFLPGDILHFLTNPNRFKMKPSFFDFSENNRHDDFISLEDPGPTLGFFIIALANLFNIKKWKHVFFR